MTDSPPSSDPSRSLHQALWRLYQRPARPLPWAYGGNLPWDDPAFSERMLREHLDQSHSAASRTTAERALQIDWFWARLGLQPGDHLLDVTCGPGLYAVDFARRGVRVTGVDFAPAALRHARELADQEGVGELCTFLQADVRGYPLGEQLYDHAMLIYGQLAVMSKEEAAALLQAIGRALKPGGRLVLELLDPDHIDRQNSTWWFTDDSGLWGEAPFLCLGERQWQEGGQIAVERFHIFHLEDGRSDEIILCDQAYPASEMTEMLHTAGFEAVEIYRLAEELPLYDKHEWLLYIGRLATI